MESIFRYPGGKARRSIREWILAAAPPNFTEYREPFVGGGGIFFSIHPQYRWINDLNEGLISVYLALRDRPQEFAELCRQIHPALPNEPVAKSKISTHGRATGKALYNARLKTHFEYFAENATADPALRYFFINRTVWAGRVVYEQKSRLYYSNPRGWNIVGTNKLEQAAEHLQHTKITTGSYQELLSAPGKQVWIYCDPPYVINTRMSNNSKQYRDNFTEEDHVAFATAVKNSPHQIAISYDDDPLVRELYPEPEFHYKTKTWAYQGTAGDASQVTEEYRAEHGEKRKKRQGKEVLITNYRQ